MPCKPFKSQGLGLFSLFFAAGEGGGDAADAADAAEVAAAVWASSLSLAAVMYGLTWELPRPVSWLGSGAVKGSRRYLWACRRRYR